MISPINEIIEDIKNGKMVIITDDEDRENEGDLIIASEKITKEGINFMATHGKGLICLTLTQERCQQLNLPLMVSKNNDLHGTNFTLSIEAAKGVTTGISASDRAKTIHAAVAKNARPTDIVQPGHIFPLMAKKGGVLVRAGHTEAGCDLAQLANLEPSSVIVEILNEDGTMARSKDLKKFSKKHNIKIGTIADLIEYKIKNEKSIEKISERPFNNKYGSFTLHSYLDTISNNIHVALVKGSITKKSKPYVRVHMENLFKDILQEYNSNTTISDSLNIISKAESGVLLLIRKQSQNQILNQATDPNKIVIPDNKTFGIGAQILADLNVNKMILIGKEKDLPGIEGFGLEIVGYRQ